MNRTGLRARYRAGNLLIAALILSLMIFVAVSSLDFLTRADVSATANFARELKATYLAESIASQIEVRANRHPWEERFWFVEALEPDPPPPPGTGVIPSVTFTKKTTYVDLSLDTLKPADYDFMGVVKDVDSGLKEYRIYVEVNYQGSSYAYSWDKRFQDSLLGSLNQDTARLDKQLEDNESNTPTTDQYIDNIKASARAPSPDGLLPDFVLKLEQLQNDQKKYEGATGTPVEPSGSPALPLPPRPLSTSTD